VAVRLVQLGFEADAATMRKQPVATATHVVRVLRLRGHAGEPHVIAQLLHESVVVRIEIIQYGLHRAGELSAFSRAGRG